MAVGNPAGACCLVPLLGSVEAVGLGKPYSCCTTHWLAEQAGPLLRRSLNTDGVGSCIAAVRHVLCSCCGAHCCCAMLSSCCPSACPSGAHCLCSGHRPPCCP